MVFRPVLTPLVAFRLPTLANQAMIKDTGNVVLGGQGPVFRTPAIVDGGKVRLGGQGPAFRQASIADAGKVRLGGPRQAVPLASSSTG